MVIIKFKSAELQSRPSLQLSLKMIAEVSEKMSTFVFQTREYADKDLTD